MIETQAKTVTVSTPVRLGQSMAKEIQQAMREARAFIIAMDMALGANPSMETMCILGDEVGVVVTRMIEMMHAEIDRLARATEDDADKIGKPSEVPAKSGVVQDPM